MTTVIWRDIADSLRARIATGALPPGAKVPSEEDLAAEHGCHRFTARAALQRLEQEGLLAPGKPRRVARYEPLIVHVSRTADWATDGELPSPGADAWVGDMLRAGQDIAQDIEVTRPLAGPGIAAWLGVPENVVVTSRRLLRRAGERPHNLITFWFPQDVADLTPLEHPDSIKEGSLGWLEKHHGPLTHSARVRSRMPAPAETDALRIPPGVPVTTLRRISSSSERPVVASLAVYPADRTELAL